MKSFIQLFLLVFFISGHSYGQSSLSITTSTTSGCNKGTLTIEVTNGTPPYTYYVGNGDYQYSSGAVSFTHLELTDLPHGTYFVSVSDLSGWYNSIEKRETIASAFDLSIVQTPQSCQNDGSISVTPSGGTAPYTYLWNTGATTSTIEQLNSAPYLLKVTDANGCTAVTDSMFLPNESFDLFVSTRDYTCQAAASATVYINENGESGEPYTYYWKTTPIQTTQTANGLTPGIYELIVTSANGCAKTREVTIEEGNSLTLTSNRTPENCKQSNGSVSVIASGGTAPYSYLWNDGSTSSTMNNMTAYTNYKVTVTDATGCKSNETYYLPRTSPLELSFSSTPAVCLSQGGLGGSLTVVPRNGTSPYTYIWSNSETTASINNLSSQYYYVGVEDANGCEASSYTFLPEKSNCKATIRGTIYSDVNGNCVQDNGEKALPYATIYINNSAFIYADKNGNYSARVNPGTYTISAIPIKNWTVTCPSNAITVDASVGGNTYPGNDFYITPGHILSDVSISSYAPFTRTGTTNTGYIYYRNNGTQVEDATITYTFSEGWSFSHANPMPDAYDASTRTAIWQHSNLNPNESFGIDVWMSVPTTAAAGEELSASALIEIANNDANPSNNTSSFVAVVRNSYDPNDIQVSPQGEGEEGFISEQLDELTYRIRFQNTGNDVAYNIYIKSKIDVNLEDYSISLLDVSHNVEASIYDDTLRFDFKDIYLADSTSNEKESHGYIVYRVNKKSDLAPLTQIFNKADIYFDYNAPVETNKVKNTIASTTPNVSELQAQDDILFYPNPCRDHAQLSINIKASSEVSVQLYSASGQQIPVLENLSVGQGSQVIDLNLSSFNLTAGLYVAKVVANDKVYTKSILINK